MKSSNITLGGILTALTIIILYAASFLPISTITVLTISSSIVPICIIRSNVKTSVMVYLASSVISLLLLPTNIWLLYTLVFGGYGIVKFFIEKKRNIKLEIILKFIYFSIIFALGVLLAKVVLGVDMFAIMEGVISRYITVDGRILTILLYWIIAQVVFYLYDYALTLIITFYMERIHSKIK